MLDNGTKRRIDTARDILVGKVPDPKSQVEQITIALIYKFMDDMDAQSEELGGQRKFFAGDFARYGWAKLMHSGLGGHETLNLYAEAIARMPENPGIPLLFREIFKNAYLPYRDPETLRAFLKVIDEFSYDHAERLGDAYEYLLSVLGSQGDAGQFRTPRHIIDFIVGIIDPQKNETVLDPACGTAGFLISSYKHIEQNNRDASGNSTLTPDDKGRLAKNFLGYDISPDMVRLSLANMYLHGFIDPHIFEYDTLTSLERWNEYADVILANPPFMSPKGGIRPHNRFSVESKRSEVLFVDYMAEHLTPKGRAGFIVPEGIIFQSQNAYKQLRQKLVEDYLVAVISLPSGVFQPYSGVKTSILILDKMLVKKTNTIAFFKVENDGYGLGAQRRPIDKNDLPQVLSGVKEYLRRISAGEPLDDFQPARGLIVDKANVAANGEYNLGGERYREEAKSLIQFPYVKLGEVLEILDSIRKPITKSDRKPGPYPYYGATGILDYVEGYLFDEPLVLVGEDGAKWGAGEKSAFAVKGKIWVNNHAHVLRPNRERILNLFLIEVLNKMNLLPYVTGVTVPKLNQENLRSIEIPLPPLEVQKVIMAEIEGYQKVIDGARAVINNYRPHVPINPEWPMVELREVCEINPETINPASAYPNQTVFYIDISSVENETGRFLGYTEVASSDAPSRARRGIKNDDVLISTVRPNLKAFTLLKEVHDRSIASTGFAVLRPRINVVDPVLLFVSVRSDFSVHQMIGMMGKGAYPSINQTDVSSIKIPLPPLAVQKDIVAEIEVEQALVNANRELIERFQQKIQTTLARIWSEDKPDALEV